MRALGRAPASLGLQMLLHSRHSYAKSGSWCYFACLATWPILLCCAFRWTIASHKHRQQPREWVRGRCWERHWHAACCEARHPVRVSVAKGSHCHAAKSSPLRCCGRCSISLRGAGYRGHWCHCPVEQPQHGVDATDPGTTARMTGTQRCESSLRSTCDQGVIDSRCMSNSNTGILECHRGAWNARSAGVVMPKSSASTLIVSGRTQLPRITL